MRSTAITRSSICATLPPVMPLTRWRRMKSTAPFRRYPDFMERCMKPPIGSPQLYLASSVTEQTLVANSEQRLHSVLATLEECRAALVENSDRDTALLVSVAILELRMKLNHVA